MPGRVLAAEAAAKRQEDNIASSIKSAFAQSLSPGKSARTSATLFEILNFAFARFCFWVLCYRHSRQNKAYYVSRLE
jgi:hypothetical protein